MSKPSFPRKAASPPARASDWTVISRFQHTTATLIVEHMEKCSRCNLWAGGTTLYQPCGKMRHIVAHHVKTWHKTIKGPERYQQTLGGEDDE